MIQTVGIRFQAEGLDTVSSQMRVLAKGVKSLVTGIKKLEKLDTSKAITNLNRLALGMGNAASKLTMAANEINAAVTAFTGANAVMGRGRPGGVVGGDAHGSSKKPDLSWYSPAAILSTTGNLAKYSVAFGALYGAKEAAMMGAGTGREDMRDALLNLHAIGYKSKEDKKGVEDAATAFAKKIRGDVSIAELMNVYAEMGSAIPHDDKTAPALTKKTHAVLMEQATALGRLSQMTPVAAAGLLESIVSAQYLMGKPDVKHKMRNQSGYLENLSGNMAGQMYRGIDIFKLKGQDIAEFMKYMTPSMIEKGWDFPTMVALAGMGSSIGFRTNMQGRGTKTLLDSRPEQLGELLIAGSADKSRSDWYRGLKASEQKAEGWKEFQKYESEFKKDLVGWMTKYLSPAAQRAQQYKYNLAEFSGSDFLPLAKAMMNPEFLQSLAHSLQQIRETQMGEGGLQKEYGEVVKQDSAWLPTELKNSWDELAKAMGQTGTITNTLATVFVGMGKAVMDITANLLKAQAALVMAIPGAARGLVDKGKRAVSTVKDWWNSGMSLVDYFNFADKRDQNAFAGTQTFSKGLYGKDSPFGHWQNNMMATLHGSPLPPPPNKAAWHGASMGMFNVPNIAPTIPQMTQTVNVVGTGEVTVWIKQDGKPDEKKSAPMTFNNVVNSTGRVLGSYDQVQPDFQGGQ